jgi:hypothetical protein
MKKSQLQKNNNTYKEISYKNYVSQGEYLIKAYKKALGVLVK